MDNIISQMVILLLIVVAGLIANKCGLMGGDFDRRLSNFVITVSCPCLIISSVMGDSLPDRRLILPLLAVATTTYVLLFFIAWLLPKLFVRQAERRGMFSFMLMFANVGFIGYPIVAAIFGKQAIFYAALLNAPGTLFIFVAGTAFILGDGGKLRFDWHTLYCPAMIAAYVSILIVALGVTNIPRVVAQPFHLIGDMTVPAALLVIGSSMATIDRRHLLGSVPVYVMTFFRLIAIPVFFFFLFRTLGVSPIVNNINTVVIGMPVASYGTMFCLKYGRDTADMVQGTLITTVLSVVSIPLLTLLFSQA